MAYAVLLCLFVYLSHVGVLSKWLNKCSWFLAQVSLVIKSSFLWNFVLNSEFSHFSASLPWHINCHKCCQVGLTNPSLSHSATFVYNIMGVTQSVTQLICDN